MERKPIETVDDGDGTPYQVLTTMAGYTAPPPTTPLVPAPDAAAEAPPVDPYAALDPTAPLGLRYTRRNLVVPGLPPRDLTVQEVIDLVQAQDDGGPIRGGLTGLLHPMSGAYEATPDTPTLPTWLELHPDAGNSY